MFPELIRIFDFPIHTYGVMLALGIMCALFAAQRLARQDNIQSDRVFDLGLWTIIGGLLGSKLLMIFTDENFRGNLWNLLSLDFLRSGGVFYGGLIGGFFTLLFLIRYYKLPFWKVADAFAPGVALGQFFGRQGCNAAGCCWGKETDLPWHVHFSELGHEMTGVPIYREDGGNLYLHPVQLYESLAMLAVFGVLFYLHKRKKFDGQILILYMICYPLIRFTIEFFRDDPRGDLFGLTTLTNLSTSQIISLIVAVSSIVFLYFRLSKKKVESSQDSAVGSQ
jgi:phosphatidylglycerol---prolipoprotein diacylglyceryl transferase